MTPNISLRTAVVFTTSLLAVALAAGTSSALFLWLLEVVSAAHERTTWLVWTLPVLGGIVGYMYQHYGNGVEHGTSLLYEQIDSPTQRLPLRMAPLVLVGTLLTHVGGGSAGREGTAVQMSGVFADVVAGWFQSLRHYRQHLLLLGVAAGFGSVFGTPIAGAIFALEVVAVSWSVRRTMIIPALCTGYVAHVTCMAWGIRHMVFPSVSFDAPYLHLAGWAVVVGVVAVVVALVFERLKRGIGTIFETRISTPWLRPVIGGVVVVAMIHMLHIREHAGLSLSLLQQSFVVSIAWYHVVAKVMLTAVTLGSGFKGGEVTPLFVMGATMGSALSLVSGPVAPMAALGMAGVFAAATRTPLASTILACEVFGWAGLPWYLLACGVAARIPNVQRNTV